MATHDIHIKTRDGQSLSFACGEDEDLLGAAESRGIFLPSQCRKGTCGACVATVGEGHYQEETNLDVLAAAACTEGKILLCRTSPRSSMTLQAPYDHSFIRFHQVPERVAGITCLEQVAPATWRILLTLEDDPEHGRMADFEPGQYMEIRVPGSTERRAYSLANVTNWDGRLEFVIRQRPGGLFSRYLESAAAGDRLQVRGPLGTFTLRENGLRPRWFVGGGTGVVPLLSMLRRMAEWGEAHPARLYFGVHRAEELFFGDVIRELQGRLPQLEVKYCVSESRGASAAFHGNIVTALRNDFLATKVRPDCYVCGSPRLVQGVTECASALGVPPAQIYHEQFTPA